MEFWNVYTIHTVFQGSKESTSARYFFLCQMKYHVCVIVSGRRDLPLTAMFLAHCGACCFWWRSVPTAAYLSACLIVHLPACPPAHLTVPVMVFSGFVVYNSTIVGYC